MTTGDPWRIFIIYILLPLIFLALAVLIINATSLLEKWLPKNGKLRAILKNGNWGNPYWLRDKIDWVFNILIVVALIVVTILYS